MNSELWWHAYREGKDNGLEAARTMGKLLSPPDDTRKWTKMKKESQVAVCSGEADGDFTPNRLLCVKAKGWKLGRIRSSV